MIDLSNYGALDENTAPSYDNIAPGGYVCKITSVKDEVDKGRLIIEYDVADGRYKDYYKNLYERAGFWGGSYSKYYKSESSIPYFKRFCTSLNESNPGLNFDPFSKGGNHNEKTLVGKLIGLALGEEEYKKADGDIGTAMRPRYETSVAKVSGIKPPKLKPYKEKDADKSPSNDFMKIPDTEDSEVPFA